MPTSLLDAALYLAGDPGLRGRPREFAENLRDLLLSGERTGSSSSSSTPSGTASTPPPAATGGRRSRRRQMLETPRIGRRSPLTPRQCGVMRGLANGGYLIDDSHGITLMPFGAEVSRLTLRALVRAGLVHDVLPLFNGEAGRLTKHGFAWAQREFGVRT